MPWLDACGELEGVGELNGCLEGACAMAEEETALWRPLVLLIPLRLGLSDINDAYIETLKVRNWHVQHNDTTNSVSSYGHSIMKNEHCQCRCDLQNGKNDR